MEEKNKDVVLKATENNNSKATDAEASAAYKVEITDGKAKGDSKKTKKQPGSVLALLSMIFAFVSLFFALANLLFAALTVVLTLLIEIMPFLHALLYFPVLIPAILAIVFARIAKKKGNKTVKVKLGLIFGIISTVILALSILGMTVLGIIAVILAVVFGITLAVIEVFITTVISGILGVLTTLSPALAPILAIVGSILVAAVPVLIKSFADAAAPEIIELIIEWIRSLISSGIILLPI